MYCRACGKQIPDDAKFCSYCSAAQNTQASTPPKKKKRFWGILLKILLTPVILFAILVVIEMLKTPETGWYETGGKTYYYIGDGKRYTGYWEIDGEAYFFDSDGVLQKDTTSEADGDKFVTDSEGRVIQICYDVYPGTWGENRQLQGNSRAAVLEYRDLLKNCTCVDFYIEASGRAGTNMDGKWQLCFKINGEWKDIQEFDYSGSSTTVTVPFDHPVTIEAVSAHPKIQGGYTYDIDFALRNVWVNE